MLFFSKEIAEFNKNYPNLLGVDDKESKDSTEETGTDGSEKDSDGQSFGTKWNLIYLVDIVSEVMKMDWHRVYELNIVEFLTVVCYYNDKAQYEKEQIKLWKQKN